jgi:hypothetical protein
VIVDDLDFERMDLRFYVAGICIWRFPALYPEITSSPTMATPAQERATQNRRASLAKRGLLRFEVVAREADRELIRALARRLAEEGPDAEKLRTAIMSPQEKYAPKKGGIYEALRRSPLVGSDVIFERSNDASRQGIGWSSQPTENCHQSIRSNLSPIYPGWTPRSLPPLRGKVASRSDDG